MEILAFDRRFDRGPFSCGKPDLDDWLKTKAGQQERADQPEKSISLPPPREEPRGYGD